MTRTHLENLQAIRALVGDGDPIYPAANIYWVGATRDRQLFMVNENGEVTQITAGNLVDMAVPYDPQPPAPSESKVIPDDPGT